MARWYLHKIIQTALQNEIAEAVGVVGQPHPNRLEDGKYNTSLQKRLLIDRNDKSLNPMSVLDKWV